MPEENNDQLVSLVLPKATTSVSPQFKRVLAEIPKLNAESERVQNTKIEDLDEDDLTELNKKMKEVTAFNKKIKGVDKAIKDAYDTPKKEMLDWFHNQLNTAGYDEFQLNVKRNTQKKHDVTAYRANQRWGELEITFKGAIDSAPKIKQLAPQLADFNTFRVRHPKLVSGAKNKKINDKIRSQVIHEVADYANALTDIEANASQLLPAYQQKLLEAYVNNPTPETLLTQNRIILNQQKADLQMQAEIKKQNELRQQQLANQQQTTPQKPLNQPLKPLDQPKVEDYTWLLNYIYSFPNGRNVHNNNRVKANVLYDMYHKINVQGSVWYQHVGTNADKVIEMTRYILNL